MGVWKLIFPTAIWMGEYDVSCFFHSFTAPRLDSVGDLIRTGAHVWIFCVLDASLVLEKKQQKTIVSCNVGYFVVHNLAGS